MDVLLQQEETEIVEIGTEIGTSSRPALSLSLQTRSLANFLHQ